MRVPAYNYRGTQKEKMDIKEILHQYLGCPCEAVGKGYGYISAVDEFGWATIKLHGSPEACYMDANGIKPILRRLSEMTEEEKTEICRRYGWFEGKKIINEHHLNVAHDTLKEMAFDSITTANENESDRLGPRSYFLILPYLTRQQFDLFNLIDNKLAIDAKTVNIKP